MIDFQRPEFLKFKPLWKLVTDICNAENLGDYLVPIHSEDTSDENVARNEEYEDRAVFMEVAGFTTSGLIGLVFEKDPECEVPGVLEYVKENVDGAGVSLYQQSQEATENLIQVGRCGLLVDFPVTPGGVSRAEMTDYFATVVKYTADQIINWRTVRVGAKVKLSLVVLQTSEEKVGEDGYSIEFQDVIKELFLGTEAMLSDFQSATPVYGIRNWVNGEKGWEVRDEMFPTDGKGQLWDEIPFMFLGSRFNTWEISHPPMYKLCKLNVAHYNNSAIYEDSVFVVGQVQPWASGLTVDAIKEMTESDPPFYIGSGRLFPVPSGEQFGFAQPAPNMLAKEAMAEKERQMIALGAMFIQPGSAVKTATQAGGEQRIQHSVLSLIAVNISEGYTQALRWAARFMNTEMTDQHYFRVNQEYVDPEATSQDLTAVVSDFMQGSMSIADFYAWKKRHGYTQAESLEEFSEGIVAEPGSLGLDDNDQSGTGNE